MVLGYNLTMKNFFFKQTLLPDGWWENVRVSVDSDGNIADVYKTSAQFPNDTVLDCVVPTMPNCHSHVFQRCMAGLTEYKTSEHDSFWSWRTLMYQYANKIDAEQMYHIAKYVYSEMLLAGYSSVCEFHYIHRDKNDNDNTIGMSMSIIRAAHDAGIQLTLLPVLYMQAHIDGTALNDLQQRFYLSVDEYITLYNHIKYILYPEQKIGLCFHSLRAVSIDNMKRVIEKLADEQPIHIHISEQMDEVNQCLESTGKRPVELLFENFDVNHNWNLVHATHLNADEIKLIADSKALAILCPLTEANLGDGAFPLSEYVQQQGRFAIGSDSHIAINPLQELQMLEYSQRLSNQKRVIASNTSDINVGTFLWKSSLNNTQSATGNPTNSLQVGEAANWLNIKTDKPMYTQLKLEQYLDTALFADNPMTETYIKGQKIAQMDKNTLENYKNTLKTLR